MSGKRVKKGHPDEVVDTELPDGKTVNEEAFRALQEAYEGDPEGEEAS